MVTGASTADVARDPARCAQGGRRADAAPLVHRRHARDPARRLRRQQDGSRRLLGRALRRDRGRAARALRAARPARRGVRSRSRRCRATTSSIAATRCRWYAGPTLLEHLEAIEIAGDRNLEDRRFAVQWVIRPMSDEHHDYRGYAGEVAGGIWRPGDEVIVLPSGRRSRVARSRPRGPLEAAIPPQSVTIRLEDDIDVGRGDMLADPERAPIVARELTAELCWMSDGRSSRGPGRGQAHDPRRARARRGARLGGRHADARGPACARAARAQRSRGRAPPPRRAAGRRSLRRNRATGAFILIDEATNDTVAAGMVLDAS